MLKILILMMVCGLSLTLPELTSAQIQKKRRVSDQTKKPILSKPVSKSSSLLMSEGIGVRLGVRSRNEQNNIYLAKFVVQSPDDDERYEAKVNVSSDFGTVMFPHDFRAPGPEQWKADSSDGSHNWHCIINGVQVGEGTFQYNSSSSMVRARMLKSVSDPKWEVIANPEIQLAVWDKHEAFEATQNALFVVIAPDGNKYEATQYGVVDWNFVYFPRDFNFTGALKGTFDYYCSINGQKMISGKFEILENGKQAVALGKLKWH